VRLIGTGCNRDAYGARVTVRAGDHVATAERRCTAGYLSGNDPRLHFGLGEREHVDAITVRWPGGATQTLAGVTADQVVTIREPAP
jgi:hypothetical protein